MQHRPPSSGPAGRSDRSAAPPAGRRSNEYDALAELFLGDESADPPQSAPRRANSSSGSAPASTQHARIEALLLGHLPVRGTIWTSQFAEAIARMRRQRVALLRLGRSFSSVDLFGLPRGARPEVEPASLDAVLRNANRLADHWIIQADELTEEDLARQTGLDRLTLLVGSNEASIVATYRTIKSLSSTNAARTPIGIAVVGVEAQSARDVLERIERATKAFLARPVELIASLERVERTSAVNLHEGSRELGPAVVIEQLARSLRTSSPPPAPPAPAPSSRPRAMPPKPAPSSIDAPSPSELLGGLTLLAARCPDDQATEIAIDAQGRLHLLCVDADGYERLSATRSWAVKHAALLALTLPDPDALDPELEPALHLFTSEPRRVRHLLDAEISLHLRASATTAGGERAWFTTELN